MSVSTLVSTLPFALTERKPGMFPSLYEIPAAGRDDIAVAHIGDAYYHELVAYGDSKTPPRKVDIFSKEIAKSIIYDYIQASLSASMEPVGIGEGVYYRIPGFFVVEDKELSASEVRKNYAHKVAYAKKCTIGWFESLIKLADDDWQKFHQHKMITDIQREACKYVGADREWNFSAYDITNNLCPACKIILNPAAIVCSACKCIVKPEEYGKLKFATQ